MNLTGYQIPRNSLMWMLIAQAVVSLPHIVRLPLWITSVCIACGVWRIMIYQGRWSYPSKWVKVGFAIVGFLGIPIAYSKLTGLEPAIALLIVAFFLKLLEMHHKKDAYLVILLGYFVAITEFLFFQSIPYAIYILISVLLITTALIGLHQTKMHKAPLRTLGLATVLLGQALPLMLVLFILFPRIPPLWTVPIQSASAKTGVSDSMSPGDIARLTQSDKLAFRATFEGALPPNNQLYWRGLVLSDFDGTTWSQHDPIEEGVWRYRQKAPAWIDEIEYGGGVYDYNVVMEPSQQNWLFTLTMPELPMDRDLVILSDYSLASRRIVRQPLRYKVRSHLERTLSKSLSRYWQFQYTQFPDASNPRVQSLAKQMYAQSNDPERYIKDVLRMYYLQQYIYTLQPPQLGLNSIDEFIFETKRGFCEHYAGSFVFMMRAAGIPARVVVGYQGGEYNPIGNYISVRQFDAHAWTEVWIKNKGWVRVDPTSAVAPERIERGLEAAVEGENSFLANSPLSIFRYRQLLWLTEIRLQMDAVGHYWDTWVVGYTPDTQKGVLSKYLGDVDQQDIYFLMLGSFFGVLALVGLILFAKRSKADMGPFDVEYYKFCQVMSKQGFERALGEAPLSFARRIIAGRPELSDEVESITTTYMEVYAVDSSHIDRSSIRKSLRALRLKMFTANV